MNDQVVRKIESGRELGKAYVVPEFTGEPIVATPPPAPAPEPTQPAPEAPAAPAAAGSADATGGPPATDAP